MIYSEYISRETKGFNGYFDITEDVKKIFARSQLSAGLLTVHIAGATAGIVITENEPGLLSDIIETLEMLSPQEALYHHDAKWRDGNGFSHIRSALIGSSKTIPFSSKSLLLGISQQIIFFDFDNRARSRKIFVQVLGE
ncbi:MAG: secondary thiamine-phosphate synthase enzyme YjbQ [Elusimicrobiota bacterium]|jgi:secondary thiamine-phosphate synthase enzyme|nr:secondary thiamine-phosphate synthase enzyme YjbQ [Elusimicrobiota bacterium]